MVQAIYSVRINKEKELCPFTIVLVQNSTYCESTLIFEYQFSWIEQYLHVHGF